MVSMRLKRKWKFPMNLVAANVNSLIFWQKIRADFYVGCYQA